MNKKTSPRGRFILNCTGCGKYSASLDAVRILKHRRFSIDAQTVADKLHKVERGLLLPLHGKHPLNRLFEASHKIEQLLLVGVRGVSLYLANFALYIYHLAEHLHLLFAIQKPPSQGTGNLVTCNKKYAVWIRQISPLMVQNASGIRHARAGNNHLGRFYVVNRL